MTNEPLRTPAIAAARAYETLPAWQKSMTLAEQIYAATENFPAREHQGLALLLRHSSIYVASALAAGSAGRDEEDITDYYREAQSALAELATQIALAQRLGLLAEDAALGAHVDDLTRLMIGLQHGLRVKAKDEERRAREEARSETREERPRREFKPREERGDRGGDRPYRKPFVKRDDERGEDRPRREFKPREDRGGDRPYRKREEQGDRRGFSGGKKPYVKRDFSGKPKRRD